MASRQVLYFIAFFFLVSSSHSSGIEPSPSAFNSKRIAVKKVALSLYYEALCPYCENFIVKPLAEAVKSDLITIVDLQLFPWGNAVLKPNNTVICQHGEDECYLNTIHACAINIWPSVVKHFVLIECIEEQTRTQVSAEASWQLCADKLKLPKQSIKDCYDSGYGRQLLLQVGNKTSHLNPPHEYVPWVVVNGKPLFDDYENFVNYVCKAYKGKPLPKACSTSHVSSASKGSATLLPVTPSGAAIPGSLTTKGSAAEKSTESVPPKGSTVMLIKAEPKPPK